eukprot:GILI01007065.1.p1 GENE.GILI01007065.1~~GILI01007065.1.p1  ORF type:complete len:102 (+),score=39.60 GILI01007065.1:47-352(+)
MVLPPKHVYSAKVKNTSDKDVEVTATYALPNGTQETVTINIAAAAEGQFDEKTIDVDTATHIANIVSLAVAGGETVQAPFNVSSPTKGHGFTITSDLKIQN